MTEKVKEKVRKPAKRKDPSGKIIISYSGTDCEVVMTPSIQNVKLLEIIKGVEVQVAAHDYTRMTAPKGRGAKPRKNRKIAMT